eukprot:1160378-Pelagomonas_calceolata.AAC.7
MVLAAKRIKLLRSQSRARCDTTLAWPPHVCVYSIPSLQAETKLYSGEQEHQEALLASAVLAGWPSFSQTERALTSHFNTPCSLILHTSLTLSHHQKVFPAPYKKPNTEIVSSLYIRKAPDTEAKHSQAISKSSLLGLFSEAQYKRHRAPMLVLQLGWKHRWGLTSQQVSVLHPPPSNSSDSAMPVPHLPPSGHLNVDEPCTATPTFMSPPLPPLGHQNLHEPSSATPTFMSPLLPPCGHQDYGEPFAATLTLMSPHLHSNRHMGPHLLITLTLKSPHFHSNRHMGPHLPL